jgi:hypothetical protein
MGINVFALISIRNPYLYSTKDREFNAFMLEGKARAGAISGELISSKKSR